jgi:hypothetical protein
MSCNEIDINAVNARPEAARLLGKLGGQAKSEAKTLAARANAKKPRKKYAKHVTPVPSQTQKLPRD